MVLSKYANSHQNNILTGLSIKSPNVIRPIIKYY